MKRFSLPAVRALSSTELIVIVSVFVALFSNTAFFSSAAKIYSLDAENILFILSLFARITAVFIIMLLVVCHKFLVKPVLIVFLLLSSLITYFMNQYGIIVDYRMIDNVLETDFAEVRDLISFPLVKYVFFLGIL
ncbi:MAG TPA: DUF1705 domain-containing protein, partial [Rhizobiales bacterium]|nr:DUF1705 domain-containing protein [Hyphomicrobiales bacterium]